MNSLTQHAPAVNTQSAMLYGADAMQFGADAHAGAQLLRTLTAKWATHGAPTFASHSQISAAAKPADPIPPMVDEPDQKAIDAAFAEQLRREAAARKAAQQPSAAATKSPAWREGYEAGRTGQQRDKSRREPDYFDGYDTGHATTGTVGPLPKRGAAGAGLVNVQRDGYDLSLWPWEDAATVIAEVENIRDEEESQPGIGWEFTDEELEQLFTGEAKRVASDPMLARWEAEGMPGGFMFTRDFADVVAAEDRDDWVGA